MHCFGSLCEFPAWNRHLLVTIPVNAGVSLIREAGRFHEPSLLFDGSAMSVFQR